jgi:hypothetical protein
VFAPGHLGELTQVIPFEMVDEVLAETGAVERRLRDLPSRVVVYLLLAAGLFAGLGYRQVWARLVSGLADPGSLPSSSALAQARRRARPRVRCGGGGCWFVRSTAPRCRCPTARRI